MFGKGPEKQQAVAVALPTPCFPITPSIPDGVVTTNSRVEVAKDDELVNVWFSGDGSVQVFVELVLDLVWVGHSRSIDTDNDGKLLTVGTRESPSS